MLAQPAPVRDNAERAAEEREDEERSSTPTPPHAAPAPPTRRLRSKDEEYEERNETLHPKEKQRVTVGAERGESKAAVDAEQREESHEQRHDAPPRLEAH